MSVDGYRFRIRPLGRMRKQHAAAGAHEYGAVGTASTETGTARNVEAICNA